MPYITSTAKTMLKSTTDAIELNPPTTPGELNFLITTLCQAYLNKLVIKNYQAYNDTIGALESCKLEFYRRAVAPYEDDKISENGDVF
jgi:hypothetical protein